MSKLYLEMENLNGKTVISDSFFTAPIKIAKPFYHLNHTEIIMMSASAGLLDGDFYNIELKLKKDTSVKFTGQSYNKIFKCDKVGISQEVKINLDDNSYLVYFPMPTIPFEGSIFKNNIDIHLKSSSKIILCDILSCGRVAMNEMFKFKSYRSRMAVYIDNQLQFLDNQRLVPSEMDLSNLGFFEKFTHIGLVYIYGFDIKCLPQSDILECAISKAKKGYCIRIFSNSSDDIVKYINTNLLDIL